MKNTLKIILALPIVVPVVLWWASNTLWLYLLLIASLCEIVGIPVDQIHIRDDCEFGAYCCFTLLMIVFSKLVAKEDEKTNNP